MNEKKKLLYIVRYPIYEDFNLRGKFDGQRRGFEKLGYDVYYLAFDRKYFYLINNGQKQIFGKAHWKVPGYFHTMCYQDLYTSARKAVQSIAFDCVYCRAAPNLPASLRLAKQAKRSGSRLIYEYPTYPLRSEKSMSLLRSVYAPISVALRKRIENLVDGFVLIGEDAGGMYNGKPAINIANGIDPDVIPLRKYKPDPDAIHILLLASMSYWHGYDRLIRSLHAYNGEPTVVLHMVGGNDGGMLPEWKKLTEALQVEDRVLFHGKLYGEELSEMFDLCDVGINSLGMYRKGFSVTSELKTREYAARGLPFVCSVEDPVLQHAQETFWFRVSNDDTIPDMQQIVAFAKATRADREHPEKLRAYAQQYMSWEGQYAPLMKMFTEE